MKFGQQVAHGLLEAVCCVGCFNQWTVAAHSGLPIVIQLFWPIESLLQSGQDFVKNCASVAGGKLRMTWLGRMIHCHRELLDEGLPSGARKRLLRGSPSSTKPAQ